MYFWRYFFYFKNLLGVYIYLVMFSVVCYRGLENTDNTVLIVLFSMLYITELVRVKRCSLHLSVPDMHGCSYT